MPTICVRDMDIVNGLVVSRSILLPSLEEHAFVGFVDFGTADPFADPKFWFVLKMYRSMDPERSECKAVHEFPLLDSQQVTWTGIARRLWLTLETSSILYTASLSISY